MPICFNSSSRPLNEGSSASKGSAALRGGAWLSVVLGGGAGTGAGAGGGLVGLGVVLCPPSRLPNKDRPRLLPPLTGAGPWPRVDAKGVCLVSLLACFSRSWNFLMKVLASFSSANENAAGHSSSSNV